MLRQVCDEINYAFQTVIGCTVEVQNGSFISYRTLNGMLLLIHAGVKLTSCYWKRSQLPVQMNKTAHYGMNHWPWITVNIFFHIVVRPHLDRFLYKTDMAWFCASVTIKPVMWVTLCEKKTFMSIKKKELLFKFAFKQERNIMLHLYNQYDGCWWLVGDKHCNGLTCALKHLRSLAFEWFGTTHLFEVSNKANIETTHHGPFARGIQRGPVVPLHMIYVHIISFYFILYSKHITISRVDHLYSTAFRKPPCSYQWRRSI